MVRESRVDGEGRWSNDQRKVRSGVVVVAARDHHEMNEGVRHHECGASHGCRPIAGAPGPGGERQARGEESRADILDKWALNGPVSGTPGTLTHQLELANSMTSPLAILKRASAPAIHRRIETSCASDDQRRWYVTWRRRFFV